MRESQKEGLLQRSPGWGGHSSHWKLRWPPMPERVCVCVRGSVCEGETESNACNPINMNWTAHKSCCPPNTKHFVRERSQIEDLCPILLAYVKLTPTVLCKYRMCAKSKAWQSKGANWRGHAIRLAFSPGAPLTPKCNAHYFVLLFPKWDIKFAYKIVPTGIISIIGFCSFQHSNKICNCICALDYFFSIISKKCFFFNLFLYLLHSLTV